jgi:GT2 family glycosyltransferase
MLQDSPAAACSVAVIICAYTESRWELIRKAVDSVEAQTAPAKEVVIVVDHNDVLLEMAQQEWPTHMVIANERQRGLSGARNTGVTHATGEVVAFLDDDAAAHANWLERLVAQLDDQAIAGVGGLVRAAWAGERPRWFPDEFLWVVGCSYRGLPDSLASIRNPIGASMAFRRSLILEVGGFNQDVGRVGTLPVGCEETELSIRLRRSGFDILYEPEAVVDHVVPAERGRFSYFLRRCLAEGRSKAAVTRMVGASSALDTERQYVRRVLPGGVAAALWQGLRGPTRWGALRKAGAIPMGLWMTAWGYLSNTLRYAFKPRMTLEQLRSRPSDQPYADADDVLPGPWSGATVAVVDTAALACATVLAAFVLADATSILRAATALSFFLIVPGWSLLRVFRARPCSLTLMGAVAMSMALTLIAGQVLVTSLGFPWRGATILACGLSAMVLVVDLGARRWQ